MKLLEFQRTVIEGCRQAETIFYQVLLSCPVASIHGSNLRDAHMALVNHKQEIFREEIEQAIRAFAFMSAIKIAGIVLDARTVAQFLDHFHIIFYTFLDALCLDSISNTLEEFYLFNQVVLNSTNGTFLLFFCCYEKVGWINLVIFERSKAVISERIHFFDTVNLIVPPCYAQNMIAVSHKDVNRFAFHSKVATLQFYVISNVKCINEFSQKFISVESLPAMNLDDVLLHRHRSAHTIDARYG